MNRQKELPTLWNYYLINFIFRILKKFKLPVWEFYGRQLNKEKKKKLKKYIPESLKLLKELPKDTYYISDTCPIYLLWWQGEEQMPPYVKFCYDQLKRMSCRHPIELINEDNIASYYPEYEKNIKDLLKRNILTIQYFSDILRTSLLHERGGIWIDATIYLNKPIDEIITTKSFYTGRRNYKFIGKINPAMQRFTSFFNAAGKNNHLMNFIKNGLIEALKKYQKIPDYLTIDLLFAIAYDESDYIRNIISQIPPFDGHYIVPFNKEMSKDEINKLIKDNPFFKGNWRTNLDPKNTNTLYGYLCSK